MDANFALQSSLAARPSPRGCCFKFSRQPVTDLDYNSPFMWQDDTQYGGCFAASVLGVLYCETQTFKLIFQDRVDQRDIVRENHAHNECSTADISLTCIWDGFLGQITACKGLLRD